MKEVSVKKNLLFSTAYQILLIILPFFTAPYVSRVLGSDKIGIYSYTGSIRTYFSMFAALGTASYGMRCIARVRDDKEERSQVFWEIEILTVITTSICLLIWWIMAELSKEYGIYYKILSLALLAALFDISWFYQGIERFKYIVTQNAVCKLIGVVCIFLFVKEKSDLGIYILILSLVTLLSNMTMWIYLPHYVFMKVPHRIHLAGHFRETLIYFLPTIATSIYTVLDKTLIGWLTHNEYENGYYEQATKIINMAKSVTFGALNSVLGSRISYLFAQNRTDEIRQRIDTSMNFMLMVGIGFAFGISACAKDFVPVFFGEGYDEVVTLLYIFSPIIVIIGISNTLGSLFYSPAGYRQESTGYLIAGSCVNLVLNLLLIPRFNSAGASFASVMAEGVITVLYVHFSRGYMSWKTIGKHSVKRVLAGILMAVVILGIQALPIGISIRLVLEVICGMAVYALVLCLMKDEMLKLAVKKMKR